MVEYFFSSVSVYLFPQKRSDRYYIGGRELSVNKIWNTKKYPAQMLKVAGDLRRPPAKFENPAQRVRKFQNNFTEWRELLSQ